MESTDLIQELCTDISPCSENEMRLRIEEIERKMVASPDLVIFTPTVREYFAPGIYAREMSAPAGSYITGKIHKFENFNIVSKGSMEVLIDGKMELIKAPFAVVSPPGTKRIAHFLEDTVWTTMHGTHETDPVKIEAEFIAQDNAEYLAFKAKLVEIGG